MPEYDEDIQEILDGIRGKADIGGGEDMIAYRRLFSELDSPVIKLSSNFPSRVMIKIIDERIRIAKRESTVASLMLTAVSAFGVITMFVMFSVMDWFKFEMNFVNSVISMAPASINYIWPCVLTIVLLAIMDRAMGHFRQSAY